MVKKGLWIFKGEKKRGGGGGVKCTLDLKKKSMCYFFYFI